MSSAGCVSRSGTTEHLINSEYNPEKIARYYGVRTPLRQVAGSSQNTIHGSFLHGHSDYFCQGKKHSITEASTINLFGGWTHNYGFYPPLTQQFYGGIGLPTSPFKAVYHSSTLDKPHSRGELWEDINATSTKTYQNATLQSDSSEQYTTLTVAQSNSGQGAFNLETGELPGSNNPYRTLYKMRLYTGCSNSNIIYVAGPTRGYQSQSPFSDPLGEGQSGIIPGMQLHYFANSAAGTPTRQLQSGGTDRILITEVEDTGTTVTMSDVVGAGSFEDRTTPLLKLTLDTNITLGTNVANGVYVATISGVTQGGESFAYIICDCATDVADTKSDADTYTFVHPSMLVKKIIWEHS